MVIVRVLEEEKDFYCIEINKDVIIMLFKKEVLFIDKFYVGDCIKVYVMDVEMKMKGFKIYVFCIYVVLVICLFEEYVLEIKDGMIEVLGIVCDLGDCFKVGLKFNNENVDVIGVIVGEGGVCIKEIFKFLFGEKIDLFRWSDNE